MLCPLRESSQQRGNTKEQQGGVPARRAGAENELQTIKDVGKRGKASCADCEGRVKAGGAAGEGQQGTRSKLMLCSHCLGHSEDRLHSINPMAGHAPWPERGRSRREPGQTGFLRPTGSGAFPGVSRERAEAVVEPLVVGAERARVAPEDVKMTNPEPSSSSQGNQPSTGTKETPQS